MTPPRTAAVVGLGLIGGSVARELEAAGWSVLGHDADPDALEHARAEGVAAADLGPGMRRLTEAEWVIVAVPVDVAPALLAEIAPLLSGAVLVTDVGSTKRSIVAAAERLGLGHTFVGSHPLAGDHRSGWRASSRGLFRGARAFVTPTRTSTPETLNAARELWGLCGARVEMLDAEEHDARLAWISHLPQLASSALAVALESGNVARRDLGRGGRDLTRLAGSAPDLWTAIALENADALEPAIEALIAQLGEVRGALSRRDGRAVRRLLERGHRWTASS